MPVQSIINTTLYGSSMTTFRYIYIHVIEILNAPWQFFQEVIERPRGYKPPAPDFNTEHMKVFLAYLEETEVQTKFRALMKQLFSLPMLPYNPYPGFALRFSGLEERWARITKFSWKNITCNHNHIFLTNEYFAYGNHWNLDNGEIYLYIYSCSRWKLLINNCFLINAILFQISFQS